jgi:WD40 repeat protein
VTASLFSYPEVHAFVAASQLTLEKVLGVSCLHNSSLAVNPATGEIAYAAGCVVVIYNAARNKQVRFFRAEKTVSCLAFSKDGDYLAIGERGHQPAIIVMDLKTGQDVADLKGHSHGISCVAFSADSKHLVSVGFRHDHNLHVWDWRSTTPVASNKIAQKVTHPPTTRLARSWEGGGWGAGRGKRRKQQARRRG